MFVNWTARAFQSVTASADAGVAAPSVPATITLQSSRV